jgi:hypothetical protein
MGVSSQEGRPQCQKQHLGDSLFRLGSHFEVFQVIRKSVGGLTLLRSGKCGAEKSEVIGGLGDGLGGVEREAEIAFGVAPGIIGFAGLLMSIVGKKDGAEFVSGS